MIHCCKEMDFFTNQNNIEKGGCEDDILYYDLKYDEYGIVVHDLGQSYIRIKYCPWCGESLPNSKRDIWFDELEKIGIDDPFEQEIPKEFKTDEWRKNL